MHVMFITRGFSLIQLGVQNYRNTPGRGSKNHRYPRGITTTR